MLFYFNFPCLNIADNDFDYKLFCLREAFAKKALSMCPAHPRVILFDHHHHHDNLTKNTFLNFQCVHECD